MTSRTQSSFCHVEGQRRPRAVAVALQALSLLFGAAVAVAAVPLCSGLFANAGMLAADAPAQAYAVSAWSGTVNGSDLQDAVVKLRPHNYYRTADIHNDGIAKGDVIYLYNMGTTSKWRLKNISGTDYYYIEGYSDFTEKGFVHSYLFDVDDQSKSSGAIVHSWSGTDDKHYSRHWQFQRQANGTFLIKNRNSGLWLSLSGSGADEDEMKLCQSSTPMYWDVEVVGKNNHGSDYSQDYDLLKQYSSFPGTDWMKDLPDSTPLTSLSIPGTHDSGTCWTWGDIEPQTSLTTCQQLFIREQLAAGVRFFDIRLGIDGVEDRDPYINHGGIVCVTEKGVDMRLSDVMNYFKSFLEANPTEFVIMMASNSNGDVNNQANSLKKWINDYPDLFYLDQGATPTVKDLRGKIYLAHRLDLSGTSYGTDDLGLNLVDWDSHDYNTSNWRPIEIESNAPFSIFVQDDYNDFADQKIHLVGQTLYSASHESPDALFINYTSCTKNNPFSAARYMNENLQDDVYFTGTGRRLGIVTMDFIDSRLAWQIYRQNPGVGTANETFANAPLTSKSSTLGTWLLDGRWWYCHHDGSYTRDGWEFIDGAWYRFDRAGWMQAGWVKDDGVWYYLDDSGAMQTGWLHDGDAWYYLDDSGAMQTGWFVDDGTWYCAGTSGALKSGWLRDGGTWYYLHPSHDGRFGAMDTGWVRDGGAWYYLNGSGAMTTGWQKVQGTWYYLSPNAGAPQGSMQTGWLYDKGAWYYLDGSGAMAKNTWIGKYHVNGAGVWDRTW